MPRPKSKRPLYRIINNFIINDRMGYPSFNGTMTTSQPLTRVDSSSPRRSCTQHWNPFSVKHSVDLPPSSPSLQKPRENIQGIIGPLTDPPRNKKKKAGKRRRLIALMAQIQANRLLSNLKKPYWKARWLGGANCVFKDKVDTSDRYDFFYWFAHNSMIAVNMFYSGTSLSLV